MKRLLTNAVLRRMFASRVARQIRLIVLDIVGNSRSPFVTTNEVRQPSIFLDIFASDRDWKRYIGVPDAKSSHDTVSNFVRVLLYIREYVKTSPVAKRTDDFDIVRTKIMNTVWRGARSQRRTLVNIDYKLGG